MPAHVLAQAGDVAVRAEGRGGVQAAGAAKLGLQGVQAGWQGAERCAVDAKGRRRRLTTRQLLRDGVERCLAAHAAARRCKDMPRQGLGIEFDMIGKFDLDDVLNALVGARWTAVHYVDHVATALNHALAQQKSHGELEVAARRAHGHGDALLAPKAGADKRQPNLHRLFHRHEIRVAGGVIRRVDRLPGHRDATACRRRRGDGDR